MNTQMQPGDLVEKLTRKFGLGTKPDARKSLYHRLEAAVEQHGEAAYVVIASVACDAAGARQPEHYFCYSVVLRLRERHLLPELEW